MSASPVPGFIATKLHTTQLCIPTICNEMQGSCSCISQGKSACLVVCLAQCFGLACPHSLRDATNCCATHYVGASSTSHNHIKYECLCGLCSWSSWQTIHWIVCFSLLFNSPQHTMFVSKKQKHEPFWLVFLLFGGDAGSCRRVRAL